MADVVDETVPRDIGDVEQAALYSELGVTGLKHSGGRILEEFMRRLRDQRQAMKVYREMGDNDSTIGSIMFLMTALALTAQYRVEPADESEAAAEVAEFVEQCMGDMEHSWMLFVVWAITFLQFGYSFHEIVYKERRGDDAPLEHRSAYDDGKIGWRKMPIRAQDQLWRWEFGPSGETLGMWMYNHYPFAGGLKSNVFIPSAKAIHFRNRAEKDNPEGKSLLRNSVRSWWFLKRIQEIEAIGIERDLAGLPVVELPQAYFASGATSQQKTLKEQMKKIVRNIRRDESEGVLFPAETGHDGGPTGFKLRLLTTGGRRQFDTSEIKRGYQVDILSSVLMQFVRMGMDKVGSFSLASRATNLFAVAFGSILDNICETFTSQAIQPLMRLNGYPRELWPTLVHGDFEDMPLDEIGTFLEKLVKSGIPLTDMATQRKLREIAGLPEPPEETDQMEALRVENDRLKAEAAARIANPPPDDRNKLDDPEEGEE